jgi:nitrous oxidase accessory protein NosD
VTGGRVLAVVLAVLVVAAGSFVVGAGAGSREPVPFRDTVEIGAGSVTVQRSLAGELAIPKVQVFYSGYRYVVGYYGVEAYAAARASPAHDLQFGRPLAAFVTDFAGTGVELTDERHLAIPTGRATGWVPVDETVVVVGSAARTPEGRVAVPFSERSDAEAFASEYGGEVLAWDAAVARLGERTGVDAAGFRREVANRSAWADRTAADARGLLDRPVSTTVRANETLAGAIARTPPNTTLRVPPGTYAGNVTIDKPVTIRGAGSGPPLGSAADGAGAADGTDAAGGPDGGDDPDATATTIRGDGTGTVVRATAPGVAIADLRVTGVGPNGTDRSALANVSGEDAWDVRVRVAYGEGDAGIRLDNATGALVSGVAIETPASGVILDRSRGALLEGLQVRGSDDPTEGFMSVLAMYEPVVIQGARVVGGRDGVYTHRADGTVIRDSRFESLRFGVHEMYTSGTLVANLTVRDADVGIIVMTRPRSNHLVDNDVRGSEVGISPSGGSNYVAGNVLADNGVGLYVAGSRSLFERNVVVANGFGIRAATVLPTNQVVRNDVAGNGRPVKAVTGPTRVWSVGDEGNYWGPVGRDADGDGVVDRQYRPTGAVDALVPSTAGARTLAASPALAALRAVQSSVPGLRTVGVVDAAPRAEPVRPATLARLGVDGAAAGTASTATANGTAPARTGAGGGRG